MCTQPIRKRMKASGPKAIEFTASEERSMLLLAKNASLPLLQNIHSA